MKDGERVEGILEGDDDDDDDESFVNKLLIINETKYLYNQIIIAYFIYFSFIFRRYLS